MKTKQMLMLTLLSLGVLLGREAQAFYNPSTGRWLSRDPVVEKGFALPKTAWDGDRNRGFRGNVIVDYVFNKNGPSQSIDRLGLYTEDERKSLCSKWEEEKPDDIIDAGGWVLCHNGEAVPCTSARLVKQGVAKEILECYLAHEQSHAADVTQLKSCAKCTIETHKPDAPGGCPTCMPNRPKPPSKKYLNESECKAYKAMGDCLGKYLENNPKPDGWRDAVGAIQAYLNKHSCPKEFPTGIYY